MLTNGATQARLKWKKVPEGNEYTTKYRYYAVRLPNDDERAEGIARAELLSRAKAFLELNDPQKSPRDRRRFGIANCVTDISALIVKLLEQKFVCSYQSRGPWLVIPLAQDSWSSSRMS